MTQPSANQLMKDLVKLTMEDQEYFSYYRTAGNEVLAEVAELLKVEGRFRICRQIIAGSIGKGVNLGIESEPDFDAVFFVKNLSRLKLADVVEDFKKILTNSNSSHEFLNLRTTKHSVQFTMEKTLDLPLPRGKTEVSIDFDILPAISFVEGAEPKKQAQRALKKIRSAGKPTEDWYLYSSSLSEETVQFVKDLPEFYKILIRLAKIWNEKLKDTMEMEKRSSSKISGRSTIIEIVATRAAEDVERIRKSTVLEGFRRFLNLMRRMDQIDADFYTQDSDSSSDYGGGPVIRDRVNPYNNFAAGIDWNNIQHFKRWACKTRKLLNLTARSAHEEDYQRNFHALVSTYF